MQLHYTGRMKTATIPAIRVAPELRAQIEAALGDDESLSQFVEAAVRDSVRRRNNQTEFHARGMASLAQAAAADDYVDADGVIASLEAKLAGAKAAKTLKVERRR